MVFFAKSTVDPLIIPIDFFTKPSVDPLIIPIVFFAKSTVDPLIRYTVFWPKCQFFNDYCYSFIAKVTIKLSITFNVLISDPRVTNMELLTIGP